MAVKAKGRYLDTNRDSFEGGELEVMFNITSSRCI